MDNSNVRKYLPLLFGVLASILLSRLSIGFLLFPVPVLVVTYNLKRTIDSFLIQFLTFVLVLVWQGLDYINLIKSQDKFSLVMSFSFYVLIALFILVYSCLRNYSSIMLRKMVVSSVPLMIVGIAVLLYLSSIDLGEYATLMASQFDNIIFEQFLGIDSVSFFRLMLHYILYFFIAFSYIFALIPIMFSEISVNRFNSEWLDSFARMKMPKKALWVMIALWLCFSLSLLFSKNEVVSIVTFNVALCFSFHYVINGISIIFAFIRKRNKLFSAGTIIIIYFIVSLIPVIGLFITVLLAFLGIFENWFVLR